MYIWSTTCLRYIFISEQGTTYIYETFFRPYVSKHENEIDRNLLELRTRAGDFVILHMQKVASYGQTRIFEILQYVASQSAAQPSRGRPVEVLSDQARHLFLILPVHFSLMNYVGNALP